MQVKLLSSMWEKLWFQDYDTLPAELFRISMGVLLVVFFLCLAPNWETYYGSNGYLSLQSFPDGQDVWSLFYWTEGVFPVWIYWPLGFFAAVGFTLGFFTRTSTIVLYVLISSMIHRNRLIVNGEDLIFRMTLFYSCFAPLGYQLSIDSWLRKRKGIVLASPKIWAIRCMQINIVLIYAFSLPAKLLIEPAWLDGTAMYWSMMVEPWARWPGLSLFNYEIVHKTATYLAIAVEGGFTLFVWFQPIGTFLAVTAAFFHISIAVLLQNVVFFTLSMAASFWIFIPAERLRSFLSAFGLVRFAYAPIKMLRILTRLRGASGENRTPMTLRSVDFESTASTSSATEAIGRNETKA